MKKIFPLGAILLAGTLLNHDGICGLREKGCTNPGFQDEEGQSVAGCARKDSSSSTNAFWANDERQSLLTPGPKNSFGVVKIFRNLFERPDRKTFPETTFQETVKILFSRPLSVSDKAKVLRTLSKWPDAAEKLNYLSTIRDFFQGDIEKEEGLMAALQMPLPALKSVASAFPLFPLFMTVENKAKHALLREWSQMSTEDLGRCVTPAQKFFQWLGSCCYSNYPEEIRTNLPLWDFSLLRKLSESPEGVSKFEGTFNSLLLHPEAINLSHIKEFGYTGALVRALLALTPQERENLVQRCFFRENFQANSRAKSARSQRLRRKSI